MRVLHICSNYTDTPLYQRLLEAEDVYGYEQAVVVPNRFDNECKFELDKRARVIKCYGKFARFFYHYKQKKIYRNIENVVNINEYDIVHAHLLFSNGYCAYKIKKEYGIPYIVTVRNTDVHAFFKRMIHLRSLGIKILLEAKYVVFISNEYKRKVLNNYVPDLYRDSISNKSVVIPNGIDDFWHTNVAMKHKNDKDILKVLTVGNIEKNKNQLLVCEALKRIQESGTKVIYNTVGKINDKKYWGKIKSYSFVEYHKPVPKEELISYYNNSDYFVLVSHAETFGLVYPEAMSQGLPVIYTRGQGFDGQYKDGVVGYAVSDKDYNELENVLTLLSNNYGELSQNCIEKSAVYNWHDIAKQYNDLYTSKKGTLVKE